MTRAPGATRPAVVMALCWQVATLMAACDLQQRQLCDPESLRDMPGRLAVTPGGERAWSYDEQSLVLQSLHDDQASCRQRIGEGAHVKPGRETMWIVEANQIEQMRSCTAPVARQPKRFHGGKEFPFSSLDARVWDVVDDDIAVIIGRGPPDRYELPPEKLYVMYQDGVRDIFPVRVDGEVLPSGKVVAIRASADRKAVWIAADRFVCRLEVAPIRKRAKLGDECRGIELPPEQRVTTISSAPADGPIWIGTHQGALHWAGDRSKPPSVLLGIGSVRTIVADPLDLDRAWALTANGSLYRLTESTATPVHVPDNFHTIRMIHDMLLLLGDGGVYACRDCRELSSRPKDVTVDALVLRAFEDVHAGPEGFLWLSGAEASALCRLETITLVSGVRLSIIIETVGLWVSAILCLIVLSLFEDWILGAVHGWWITLVLALLVPFLGKELLGSANLWVAEGLTVLTCAGLVLLHPLFRGRKLLFVVANPEELVRLRTDKELSETEQAIRGARYRHRLHLLFPRLAATERKLQDALAWHRPHIVHLSGHCSRKNGLMLEDMKTGQAKPLTAERLRQLFEVLRDNVRLVVINACYSEQHAQELTKHVDVVIGMQAAISDDSAVLFSVTFYTHLTHGRSVKEAFTLACELLPEAERGIPTLEPREAVARHNLVLFGPRVRTRSSEAR